jgi:hypothetical protein
MELVVPPGIQYCQQISQKQNHHQLYCDLFFCSGSDVASLKLAMKATGHLHVRKHF